MGLGLGLYLQHSLPAQPPKIQQGHGASKTWVSYCDGAFTQAGGPPGAEVPGAEGQPQNRVPIGQAWLSIQPQSYRDLTQYFSPTRQLLSDNTGAEPPHCRRETKHVTESCGSAWALYPCGVARSPSPLPLTLAGGL